MPITSLSKKIALAAFLIGCLATASFGQEKKKTPEPEAATGGEQNDTPLRIGTDLIQTGVTVFDKKGKFITDLKPEEFELRVDGKPTAFSFFEYVTAKSGASEMGAEGGSPKRAAAASLPDVEIGGGRTIVFFVDDVHLSFESHKRTRDLIRRFIDREMSGEDLVAIVSSTGKIGFLQQFSGDRVMLHAALEKLNLNGAFAAGDRTRPAMSEYEALMIDRLDQGVIDHFVGLTSKETPMLPAFARSIVIARARSVLAHSAAINHGTYTGLEQVVRNSARMPGRKVVFLISDGFLLDQKNTDASRLIHRITDAAARTNTVIYSLDAKGLEVRMPEGATSVEALLVQDRILAGKSFELLDGLNLLAKNTGGKLVTNTNDLQPGITKALGEASVYYLLAWEPNVAEGEKPEKLRRIEVVVKGRPDLQVRMQNGFLNEKPAAIIADAAKKDSRKSAQPDLSAAEQELLSAVRAQIPKRSLETSLVANYLSTPAADGMLLTATLQIKGGGVEFTHETDKSIANIDLVGMIYNSEGKREGYFRELLTTVASPSKASDRNRPDIYYNYQTKLKPGLYQVRVAARDTKSGNLGSNVQWIEIPDLASKKLTLSSLLLSERKRDASPLRAESVVGTSGEAGHAKTEISVDRHFTRSSFLRYIAFIYNASSGKNAGDQPDLTAELQIFRGRQLAASGPPTRILTDGQDPARLNYVAEIPLETLPPGRYELRITVSDRVAKTSASQSASFEIKKDGTSISGLIEQPNKK